MARDGSAGHRAPRWFDADVADVSQTTVLASGASLGIFLFALESERLPTLMRVGGSDAVSVAAVLVSLIVLGACTACLALRPPRHPARLGWPTLAALACSLSLACKYFLPSGTLPAAAQVGLQVAYSVATAALIFFWVQRAIPFGRPFTIRCFGAGAVLLGCLSMLTMALERTAALTLVVALPLVGVAALSAVVPEEAGAARHRGTGGRSASAGRDAAQGEASGSGGWSALRAIAQGWQANAEQRPTSDGGVDGRAHARAGEAGAVARALLKLIPFLCYAVLFGNIHFSWVDLQDGDTVSMWVQLGASIGSVLCGLAALALTRLRWGHAFESIMGLLLAAFSLVALWLSTFLTSNFAFVYLVLLNVAQKLTFLMMLLFGFPFSRNARECTALWALAYFSFYAGTCVSSLAGMYASGGELNVVAGVALAIVFVADIADIILLYGLYGDGSPEPGRIPHAAEAEGNGDTAAGGAWDARDGSAWVAGAVRADGERGHSGTGAPRAARGLAAQAAGEPARDRASGVPGAAGTAGSHGPAAGGPTEGNPGSVGLSAGDPGAGGLRSGGPAAGGSGTAGATGAAGVAASTAGGPAPARMAPSGVDSLAYTCHLIACEYELTRREEEILQLLVRGRTAARVAEALCISVATARTHQRNIYAKLGVHNQQDILDLFDRYDAQRHGHAGA